MKFVSLFSGAGGLDLGLQQVATSPAENEYGIRKWPENKFHSSFVLDYDNQTSKELWY